MNKFKTKLRELRAESGLTQPMLAAAINTTKDSICSWELGRCYPCFDDLISLANYFDVSTDYLLGLEDEFGSPTREAQVPAPQADSSVGFFHEHKSLLSDPYFIKTAKLYNAIDRSKRAMLFGYIVGFLQEQGVNTSLVLS